MRSRSCRAGRPHFRQPSRRHRACWSHRRSGRPLRPPACRTPRSGTWACASPYGCVSRPSHSSSDKTSTAAIRRATSTAARSRAPTATWTRYRPSFRRRRQQEAQHQQKERQRPVHTRSIAATAPAWALVGPPVAPALDVFAGSLAEIGRADDEDLEALRPGLVASPRIGRDAHRVALLELDDLVVELHPPAPAQDDVHLLLFLVRVAVRKAMAGRDALVAQARLLEFERLGRQADLQVRRAVKSRPDVLQLLLEVPERERHRRIVCAHVNATGLTATTT